METNFITNPKGKKLSVVVSIKQYQKMVEAMEELEDIKMYDAVKARKEEKISLKEYVSGRKRKTHANV